MTQKNIQHKDWSNQTVECTYPLCHPSAECGKLTKGKMRNDSANYPLPILRILPPPSHLTPFYHRPAGVGEFGEFG